MNGPRFGISDLPTEELREIAGECIFAAARAVACGEPEIKSDRLRLAADIVREYAGIQEPAPVFSSQEVANVFGVPLRLVDSMPPGTIAIASTREDNAGPSVAMITGANGDVRL